MLKGPDVKVASRWMRSNGRRGAILTLEGYSGKNVREESVLATIQDVELFIRNHIEDCDSGQPAEDSTIRAAEQELGVVFPEDYIHFLQRWGTLAVGPFDYYGVPDNINQQAVPNAIWFTKIKRHEVGLAEELVILSDFEGDEYVCIDTSEAPNCRLVIWDVGSHSVIQEKPGSIFDFILGQAEAFFDEGS